VSELRKQIEAILFASGKKVTYEELARLCNTDIAAVKNELPLLKKEYEERDSPLAFTEESDGWKMTVREKFLSLVHKMLPETELSKSVLETLAVIAWKHPAMQSDIIKIRTNKAYEHIEELVERGFISKEKKGRSYLIRITPKFNEYFELPNNEAIRKIFQDIQKQIGIEEMREGEETGEHLGNLEVYERPEEEKTEEKITAYDYREKEAEEEAEEPEEREETENEEIGQKIKEIEQAKEQTAEEEPEEEAEVEETEEPGEEMPEEEKKPQEDQKEKKEKKGRKLSEELEEFAGPDEEEEGK